MREYLLWGGPKSKSKNLVYNIYIPSVYYILKDLVFYNMKIASEV